MAKSMKTETIVSTKKQDSLNDVIVIGVKDSVHLTAGKEYLVSATLAKTLISKGQAKRK